MNEVAMPNTAAAPSSARVNPRRKDRPDTANSAIAAPMTRSQATEAGLIWSKRVTAIDAPMYWAIALRTKSASGEEVSRKRPTGPGAGRSAVGLIEELGIGAADLLPERLEAEPAGERERRVVAGVR